MNQVIRRSRLSTNLITAALLTLFVSGFGVFANIQIEQRNADCVNPAIETRDTEDCAVEKYFASVMPMMAQVEVCQCPLVDALVTSEH
ncbi:MAG: hypothetical protein QGD92_07120 [Gammaproteobacteria bacterium]|nr:hypothetical protein [Gammaproteobacteria bacterium]